MKKIFLALGLFGLITAHANAQNEGKSSNSKFAQNYPVCMTSHGYHVCSAPEAALPTTTTVVPDNSALNMTASLPSDNSSVSMETAGAYTGNSRRKITRIVVSYDDPHAPYEGKESMVNDGVQKNIIRNINYLDQSVVLPPNDGGK